MNHFNTENDKELCLLFFGEQWDAECKKQLLIAEKSIDTLKGKIILVKHDVDKDPELAEQLKITSIPTILILKGGREIERLAGFHHETALLRHLKPHMEKVG